MPLDMTALRGEIKADEGTVLHAYKDSLGYLTIGTGRLIDARKGGGISQMESDYLLDNNLNNIIGSLDAKLPWVYGLTDVRQRALINMAFNLGVDGLLQFHDMLTAMKAKDYSSASNHALDSKWAKELPARAKRVAEMIRKG